MKCRGFIPRCNDVTKSPLICAEQQYLWITSKIHFRKVALGKNKLGLPLRVASLAQLFRSFAVYFCMPLFPFLFLIGIKLACSSGTIQKEQYKRSGWHENRRKMFRRCRCMVSGGGSNCRRLFPGGWWSDWDPSWNAIFKPITSYSAITQVYRSRHSNRRGVETNISY